MAIVTTDVDQTERIRLWHDHPDWQPGFWHWHVELHWKTVSHRYTAEGICWYKWMARLMAKRALRRLHRQQRAYDAMLVDTPKL